MADFGSLWRRFFSRLPTTLQSHPFIYQKIQLHIFKDFPAWHTGANCERALLRFSRQRSVRSTTDLLTFRRWCPIILYWTAMRKKPPKCQETRCSIQAVTWPLAQKTKKPRQFESADASSAEPSQHASLEMTANVPSSKLLLLPGLNTVCSLFKATEAIEWN